MFTLNNTYAQSSKIKQGVATYLMGGEMGFYNAELDFNDTSSLFIFGRIGLDTALHTYSSMSISENSMKDKKGSDTKNSAISIYVSAFDSTGGLVYRNFRTKEIIESVSKSVPMDAFTVTDNWLPINWTIGPDSDTISGFGLPESHRLFPGRYYTAWFAPGIPVPYGPWKFVWSAGADCFRL